MNSVFLALVVTFAVQAMGTMVIYAPAVLVAAAQSDLGVAASAVGGFISVSYLGAMGVTVLSGEVIARLGPLRASQLALAASGLGLALIGSGDLFLFIAGAVLIGVGYGPLTPASSAILVRRAPERLRATILSIKQTGVPGGGALAGALIPLLILAFGWRHAAFVLGAACVALAALIQPTRAAFDRRDPAQPAAARGDLLAPLRLLWSNPRLREMGCIAFMYSGMQLVFGSFFVVFLTQRVGLSLVGAGGALAAGMLAGVFARVLWGVVADRLVEPRSLLGWLGLGTSVATFTIALIGPGWPIAGIYAAGIAMGVTSVAWNGVFLAEVARIAPAGNVGGVTGAGLMFAYAGVVCLPALCWGSIGLTGSYAATFLLMAVLNALVALLPLRRGMT